MYSYHSPQPSVTLSTKPDGVFKAKCIMTYIAVTSSKHHVPRCKMQHVQQPTTHGLTRERGFEEGDR